MQAIFKRDYHGQADAIALEDIAPVVCVVLDGIWEVASNAEGLCEVYVAKRQVG